MLGGFLEMLADTVKYPCHIAARYVQLTPSLASGKIAYSAGTKALAFAASATSGNTLSMDPHEAVAFAARWAAAWNAHDFDSVLVHFSDDVVFTSPLAGQIVPGSGGVIHGKQALRAYWAAGIEQQPDLRLEVLGAYAGVDALVIHYRNQRGGFVNEVLLFEGDSVVAGHATYLAVAPPASQGEWL